MVNGRIDALGRHGAQAGGGLLPLRQALAEWFEDPAFRGCAFINVVVEVGGTLPGVQQIAQRHKLDLQHVIAELLPADRHQAESAAALALALDGAIVRAQIGGAPAALAALATLLAGLQAARQNLSTKRLHPN